MHAPGADAPAHLPTPARDPIAGEPDAWAWRALLAIVALAAGGAGIWLAARTYLPFISDDALISLRYAERLLAGRGLTFTDGEAVEGYSNLLWVLAVAGGGLVHANLIDVARALGVALAVLACPAAAWVAPASWRGLVPLAAAVGTLALSHGLALWAIGGLEQPLQIALLAWGLALAASLDDAPRPGRAIAAGACLALLALTRPDGLLFTAATVAALLVAHGLGGPALRRLAPIALLPAAAWLGQLAFRLWYYGDFWPNTAYVKLSWSTAHLIDGWRYLSAAARPYAPVLLLALVVLVTCRAWRRAVWLAPVFAALAWAGYVAAIGGDIFPGRRHALPVLACAAVALAGVWRHSLVARLPVVAQALLVAAALVPYARLQATDPGSAQARDEVWEWDCATFASVLRAAYATTQPLIAADPVGCIAYFGRLPTLDMLGLNDRHIARTRPPDFGQGYIGHELGDGRYVLDRAPDLVLLCTPEGRADGCFRSGKELVALPEFHQRYVLTTVVPQGARHTTQLWVRVDSRALGVERTADVLRLPGLFFSGDEAPALLAGTSLVTRVRPGGRVRFDRLPPTAAGWKPFAQATSPMTVTIEGGAVVATAGPSGADLAEIVLRRSAS
jgi:arabinofuranosyltransferase